MSQPHLLQYTNILLQSQWFRSHDIDLHVCSYLITISIAVANLACDLALSVKSDPESGLYAAST